MNELLKREIQHRREWLTKNYGVKCLDYEQSCVLCRLWKNQEEFEIIIDVDYFNPLDYEQTK